MPTVTLNNGILMPVLGLGTWKMSSDDAETSVRTALDLGYRLIDTATLYGNEEAVGRAVRESGIPREEIFVTTKLWPTDFFSPMEAFEKSLKELGLDYVDLYLVHWPIPLMPQSVWHMMEHIYASKRTRAVGISNYDSADIKKLLSYASVVPAVNQIKFNPFNFEKETLDFCKEKNIVVEAYSPLTKGAHLHDVHVATIADRYGKTPAQILLRWALQHETVVIPKSTHKERIKENAEIFDFELSADDMKILNELSN